MCLTKNGVFLIVIDEDNICPSFRSLIPSIYLLSSMIKSALWPMTLSAFNVIVYCYVQGFTVLFRAVQHFYSFLLSSPREDTLSNYRGGTKLLLI